LNETEWIFLLTDLDLDLNYFKNSSPS
jgi:hypothetical protein